MKYYLFLDESGDASIGNPDPRFNIFVLCGILFEHNDYLKFDKAMRLLKHRIFGRTDIIFHSYEMRNKKGEFKVFRDNALLKNFYTEIEKIFKSHQYTVFASIIDKEKYHEKYPHLNEAYEDSLKFIVERSISFVGRRTKGNHIILCLEKRNEGKNRYLKKYYSNFIKYGTDYYSTSEFKMCNPKLEFRDKKHIVTGLEFADLCAYPIAWRELNANKKHPTYNLFKNKIFSNFFGRTEGLGLKRFP